MFRRQRDYLRRGALAIPARLPHAGPTEEELKVSDLVVDEARDRVRSWSGHEQQLLDFGLSPAGRDALEQRSSSEIFDRLPMDMATRVGAVFGAAVSAVEVDQELRRTNAIEKHHFWALVTFAAWLGNDDDARSMACTDGTFAGYQFDREWIDAGRFAALLAEARPPSR